VLLEAVGVSTYAPAAANQKRKRGGQVPQGKALKRADLVNLVEQQFKKAKKKGAKKVWKHAITASG
jgi:hypothetical protein